MNGIEKQGKDIMWLLYWTCKNVEHSKRRKKLKKKRMRVVLLRVIGISLGKEALNDRYET